MPITDNDIRFRASERMTDFADGGGRMSDVIILDGVDNNVFPDVTDIERLTGKVSLRKVYAGAFNADTDTFLSSHVVVDIPPTDDDTSAVIFAYGGIATERQEALGAFSVAIDDVPLLYIYDPNPWGVLSPTPPVYSDIFEWTGGGNTLSHEYTLFNGDGGATRLADSVTVGAVPSGSVVEITVGSEKFLVSTTVNEPGYVASGVPTGGGATQFDIEYTTTALPGAGAMSGTIRVFDPVTSYPSPRPYGVAEAAGITSSGATSVVASAYVQASLSSETPAARVISSGDALLIHHTESMAPDIVANSDVVNTGRTGLARLRVIGSTGVEHARFTDGQDPPSGVGCTADLTAGTVTFTDVSGMAQPVVVEHRIEEMALATSVTLTTVGLNRALSREYPAGTRVSSLLMVGDLQGRATAGFAQQAWTGVWSDAVIGGVPVGDYNDAGYPIACTNAGAVTERWAVIFTNTTSFRVIGEALGEIGTGSTGGDFEPVNPITGEPYFSLAAVGWGAGWSAGNVYRFNTIGAQAPVWALRCVMPSIPSGDDSVTLELRGYVNT